MEPYFVSVPRQLLFPFTMPELDRGARGGSMVSISDKTFKQATVANNVPNPAKG